jgi:hypothetical protein
MPAPANFGRGHRFAAYPRCWADSQESREAMTDVTPLLDAYRECVRHLWNTHFWRDAEAATDWDLQNAFDDVAAQLFRILVLRKLGRDAEVKPDYWADRDPFPFLKLEVASGRSEVMVNRRAGTGYWDDPLKFIEPGELELRFMQFFDWSLLGFREFALYRARIIGSTKHPHLVGRDALLPVGTSIRVFEEGAAQQRDAADEGR